MNIQIFIKIIFYAKSALSQINNYMRYSDIQLQIFSAEFWPSIKGTIKFQQYLGFKHKKSLELHSLQNTHWKHMFMLQRERAIIPVFEFCWNFSLRQFVWLIQFFKRVRCTKTWKQRPENAVYWILWKKKSKEFTRQKCCVSGE